MTALYWITAVGSLFGVWINIHRHVACFWIWAVTNATWAYADYVQGLTAQAVVQTAYFAPSVYGIFKWRRAQDQQATSTRDDGHNAEVVGVVLAVRPGRRSQKMA